MKLTIKFDYLTHASPSVKITLRLKFTHCSDARVKFGFVLNSSLMKSNTIVAYNPIYLAIIQQKPITQMIWDLSFGII